MTFACDEQLTFVHLMTGIMYVGYLTADGMCCAHVKSQP